MEIECNIVLTGAGATALMDLWMVVRRKALGTAMPDYALVGRWIAHMPGGRFSHTAIGKSPARRGERVIGWAAHYLIGIAFAAVPPLMLGAAWFDRPTIFPALATGLLTLAVPFLVMQPAMGAGFAASRTPNPSAARLQSLTTHVIFGAGLFLAAEVLRTTRGGVS